MGEVVEDLIGRAPISPFTQSTISSMQAPIRARALSTGSRRSSMSGGASEKAAVTHRPRTPGDLTTRGGGRVSLNVDPSGAGPSPSPALADLAAARRREGEQFDVFA
jgi:hypothetical protein